MAKLLFLLVVFTGVGAGLAVVTGLWLTRSIVRPLHQAVDLAKQIAGGDLSACVEVTTNDETGEMMRALKEMNASLVKIVGEVRQDTEAISTASTEIASGNLDLSSRTERQASALEETASSIEQFASTVKQNSESAQQANSPANSASEVALKGDEVVSEVVHTMDSINESSKRIVDIISVIDSIAFQTNILALNAAVEAARAGEQVRGFAVAASEVRSLAQRSAAAAKEIKELIDNSVAKVDDGCKLVEQAETTMDAVVQSVQRVAHIVNEITQASNEHPKSQRNAFRYGEPRFGGRCWNMHRPLVTSDVPTGRKCCRRLCHYTGVFGPVPVSYPGLVALITFTTSSMTGTSMNTPTTDARAPRDSKSNRLIAVQRPVRRNSMGRAPRMDKPRYAVPPFFVEKQLVLQGKIAGHFYEILLVNSCFTR